MRIMDAFPPSFSREAQSGGRALLCEPQEWTVVPRGLEIIVHFCLVLYVDSTDFVIFVHRSF
jgi:hypothetical protein